MNSFTSKLDLKALARDDDIIDKIEAVNDLTYIWTCRDLNKELPCVDVGGNFVNLSTFTTDVTIPAKTLQPYTAFNFILQV